MSNKSCMVKVTLIDFNPDEFRHYPLIVSMDGRDGSFNNIEDSFSKICFASKMEQVNLKVFNVIKGINESTKFLKHM